MVKLNRIHNRLVNIFYLKETNKCYYLRTEKSKYNDKWELLIIVQITIDFERDSSSRLESAIITEESDQQA